MPPARRRPPAAREERRARERRAPGDARRRSDLAGRVLVAIPAAVLAIVFVDLGGIAWLLLVAIMACACLSELYLLLERWQPISVVGYAAVIGMCIAAHYGNLSAVVGVAVATLPLLLVGVLLRGESEGATASIAASLIGVVWIGFAFAHAILLRGVTLNGHDIGKGLVIDVLVGTFLADSVAYFCGRMFGRHRLAPVISPKKTVEGLGCGVIAAILSVFCAALFQPWLPREVALLLGVSIAVLGPIGDLFESLIKRDAGAKDAGALFGAHGGALDRLDAISFTIVGAFYVAMAIPGVH